MKTKQRITVVLLVLGLSAIMAIPSALACTTRTPGYWKNHYSEWVIPTNWGGPNGFWISGGLITKQQALEILNMAPRGDARIILEQKIIAAVLSIGGDPDGAGGYSMGEYFPGTPTMAQLVHDGSMWLETHPGALGPGAAGRDQALTYASMIDYWLNYYDAD